MAVPIESLPQPRPIRARDRRTGATVMLVPSASREGLMHLVSSTECDCTGFRARGRCSHLEQARTALAAPAIPECGICGQPHKCHSPHLQSWCARCVPQAAPVRVPLVRYA